MTSAMSSICCFQSWPFSAAICLNVFWPVISAVFVAEVSFSGSIHLFGALIQVWSTKVSTLSQNLLHGSILPARTALMKKVR